MLSVPICMGNSIKMNRVTCKNAMDIHCHSILLSITAYTIVLVLSCLLPSAGPVYALRHTYSACYWVVPRELAVMETSCTRTCGRPDFVLSTPFVHKKMRRGKEGKLVD